MAVPFFMTLLNAFSRGLKRVYSYLQ